MRELTNWSRFFLRDVKMGGSGGAAARKAAVSTHLHAAAVANFEKAHVSLMFSFKLLHLPAIASTATFICFGLALIWLREMSCR